MIFARHAICVGQRVGCVEALYRCFKSTGGRASERDQIGAWAEFHSRRETALEMNTDWFLRLALRPVLRRIFAHQVLRGLERHFSCQKR